MRRTLAALGLAEDAAAAIARGSRLHLARALSWCESSLPAERTLAAAVGRLLARPGAPTTTRLGVTGPPGAGKSSLIEALGQLYAQQPGIRLAVLCVDPSSAITGGSIMGDKTRMAKLSTMDNVFIRPAAAGKALGGLSSATQSQLSLLESAGYNMVIIETVGVGQSEHAVQALVDTVLLVLPPASGDALQGMKRGLMELSHVIAVNKCDGTLRDQANTTCSEYRMAVALFASASEWKVPVLRVSALEGSGMTALSQAIARHREFIGDIERARAERVWEAIWTRVQEQVLEALQRHPQVVQSRDRWTAQMQSGQLSAADVCDEIVRLATSSRD